MSRTRIVAVAAPFAVAFVLLTMMLWGSRSSDVGSLESQAFESSATVSVETSAPGAILGANDTVDPEPTPPGSPGPTLTTWLDGDPDFLDPDTAEGERTVGRANEGSGSFQQTDLARVSFTPMSPDGTAINGLMSLAVGDGGIFGSGNGCLFSGFGIG